MRESREDIEAQWEREARLQEDLAMEKQDAEQEVIAASSARPVSPHHTAENMAQIDAFNAKAKEDYFKAREEGDVLLDDRMAQHPDDSGSSDIEDVEEHTAKSDPPISPEGTPRVYRRVFNLEGRLVSLAETVAPQSPAHSPSPPPTTSDVVPDPAAPAPSSSSACHTDSEAGPVAAPPLGDPLPALEAMAETGDEPVPVSNLDVLPPISLIGRYSSLLRLLNEAMHQLELSNAHNATMNRAINTFQGHRTIEQHRRSYAMHVLCAHRNLSEAREKIMMLKSTEVLPAVSAPGIFTYSVLH
jgi:hypothetical protein